MSDTSNLSDRVAKLERMIAEKPPGHGRRIAQLVVLLLLVLVTANAWMIQRGRNAGQLASAEHYFWVLGHASYPAGERAAAFVELVRVGNREWRGARLEGLNLGGANLANAELSGGDFQLSSFVKASLVNAKLIRSKLQQVDLTDAELSGADLSAGHLLKARMDRALCRKTNFRGAVLEQVEAAHANFIAANLGEASLLMANFTEANLSGADLSGANLEAAILKSANLSLARLTGANLKDADFTESNWWRARGLSAGQLALLIKGSAPGENAPVTLREDYRVWLKSFYSAK